jgi:hypothetical protein
VTVITGFVYQLTPTERTGSYDRRMDRTEANRRLTALNAVVLFVRPLFTWHLVLGMLLVPPIALKLGSTGWRFSRYYLRHPDYVAAGPPRFLLRITAPVVVLSTIGVFGTGVAMAVLGPRSQGLIGLHKASFVVWLVSTGLHVLAHLWRVPALARRAGRPQLALVLVALVAGTGIAAASVPLVHPWRTWVGQQHGEHDR